LQHNDLAKWRRFLPSNLSALLGAKETTMKTFKNIAAQGDLLIRRIADIPDNAISAKADNGKFVVAHSETGHNHVIKAEPGVQYFTTNDPMIAYLKVIDEVETKIEHLRSFDTHETIKLDAGNYEIRRQREYTPEGWRRVSD